MSIDVKTCPRCSQPYKYVEKRLIKEQTYYYALHYYFDENGRKHVKKCYLGAETYIYVKRVHMDSKINFHGYIIQNRYKEYLKDAKDYFARDTKYNKPRSINKPTIDPFVKELFKSRKWKVSVIVLNGLYTKYVKYAIDMGMSIDQYHDIFSSLDNSLTYSELEEMLDKQLRGYGGFINVKEY